ncbi:hypothetical protein J6590_093840 [Homalodisca vitripennis]|nr:hypothetical protein J6590_093840 [Homalodisca vitripennis]
MAALENNVPSFKLPKCHFRSLQDEIQAQVVLYLLSFSGFLISFTTRTDINIAIVAIVKLQNPSPTKTLLRILLSFAMITPSTLPLFKTTLNHGDYGNVDVRSHHEADQETRERQKVKNHPTWNCI